MLKVFSQIIPQEICLSCDICCRFASEDCGFRPKVTDEELSSFDMKSLDGNYLKAEGKNGFCKCVFFTEGDNTCRVYLKRPLECRVYPFLITAKNGKVFISVHTTCPFVRDNRATKDFEEWASEAKDFFLNPEIIAMLKKNPHLAGDYSAFDDELEYLFEVEI